MLVVGITGTNGAGKGTIVDYLVMQKGFVHFSVRDFLISEIRKRGLSPSRDAMISVANDLRSKNSPSFITDTLYELARNSNQHAVIESIRTPGEIYSLKNKSQFFLLAVDADPRIRYERILQRGSETDQVDFETFTLQEKQEMESSNPNNQNLRKCIELADFVLVNDGSIPDLLNQVENILNKIGLSNP